MQTRTTRSHYRFSPHAFPVVAASTFSVSYLPPALEVVSPQSGVASGTAITLRGTNLGPNSSLAVLWNSFIDTDLRGLYSTYARKALSIAASPSNAVVVTYGQVSQESTTEKCAPVLSWNSSTVTCVLPALVAGANYSVTVMTSANNVSTTSNGAGFVAAASHLTAVLPSAVPTAGLANVYVLGNNLGRDLGRSSVWTASVVASVNGSGLIGGSTTSQSFSCANNASAAWFTMPPFEGSVLLSFRTVSVGQVALSDNTAILSAAPPRLTSLAAKSSLDDPCAQLIPWGRSAAKDSWLWNSSSLCVQDVASKLGSLLTPGTLSAATPCFAATNQSALNFSDRRLNFASLVVSGDNLGSGSSTITATLFANATLSNGSFLTTVTPAALSPGVSLSFTLAEVLPQGAAELVLAIAFSSANSSAAGIYPRAVCPCGYYAPGDGEQCVVCPTGGVCPGADRVPLADAGYWKTVASEWLRERFVDVSTYPQVAAFVKCPVAAACLPGQRCAAGSSGWMCVVCEVSKLAGL